MVNGNERKFPVIIHNGEIKEWVGDGCPHKDFTRWERTDPLILKSLAILESKFNGEFFFTPERIPLYEAIESMRAKRLANPEKYDVEADFGCSNAICGV